MNETNKPSSRVKEFIERLKTDYEFKTIFTTVTALAITIVYAFYNGFLGIRYSSLWHGSICVYFILLALLRGIVVVYEKKEKRQTSRRTVHLVASIILLILNVALILPIALMVVQQKPVTMTKLPAILTAAYTTYKVIMASIHLKRKSRTNNILLRLLRSINFIDALVSVITLQNTLIMVMSAGPDKNMFTLAAVTSGLIWLLILFITVFSSVQGLKKPQ